jgi:hypothetical protein
MRSDHGYTSLNKQVCEKKITKRREFITVVKYDSSSAHVIVGIFIF